MQLENQNVVLTGASKGIGKALSEELASKKVTLHLVSRTIEPDVIENLKARGAKEVRFWKADLSQSAEVDALADGLMAANIQVDVLINNAGQLTGGLLEEQDPDEIEKMFAVNLNAVVRLTRRILPLMLKQKSGRIVNNASVSGKMFFPCASTYAASKAAIVAFTESLKQELRGTGVSTLLAITPGVKTDMYDDIQKLYGGHLDLSFMDSIPAEQWAKKVVEAIEDERDILWPKGGTGWGVWLGHHFPKVFESIVKKKFRR